MDKYFNIICGSCGRVFSTEAERISHEELCLLLNTDDAVFKALCEGCERLEVDGHLCSNEPPAKKRKWEEPKKDAFRASVSEITEYESAFSNRLKSFFIVSKNCFDLVIFLNSVKTHVKKCLENALIEHRSVKCNILVECVFQNIHGEETDRSFKTPNKPIFEETNLDEYVLNLFSKLLTEMEEAQLKKSGWSLKIIDGLRVRINKFNPLKGSSYLPLHKKIHNSKACINVQNNDQLCFKYAMLSKFVKENPQRVSQYLSVEHRYDFSCISFPTPLKEIRKFEKVNNVSVNVFGVEDNGDVYPLKVVEEELQDHTDLLLLSENNVTHYVYIKDFNKLVKTQLTKHKDPIVVCKRCMSKFDDQCGKSKEDKLSEHKLYCSTNKPSKIEMPLKKPYIKFEKVEKSLRVPFVIYADFECILEPSDKKISKFTKILHNHTPMSYCLYIKKSPEVENVPTVLPTEPIIYRGRDAVSNFVQQIKIIAEEISRLYSLNMPMNQLTEEQQQTFNDSNLCHICEKSIEFGSKVRDHSHISGEFRGSAHSSCNLRYQNPDFVPILFHNLSGYDSHFIVKGLGYDYADIEVIPSSEEKYISFTKKINKTIKVRYIDTLRFMPDSLENLVSNGPKLAETSKFFTPDGMVLMKRKGVFPYEYVTSWEKLEETALPPKTAFHNQLTGTNISDADYNHALSVWNHFNCKTLGEYSDLYIKTDVLLLADIFENFRNSILQNYRLDPAHFFTTPGLTWDAMLKKTGIQLDLLTEYDMLMMIENGVRGGLCQAIHRYARANNKYMRDYDPQQESSFITYLDCNNLYGYAMSKPLPYGDFKWVKNTINLAELKEDDDIGYILEVDVEYPQNIHLLHSDLPFLPETIVPPGGKFKKLIPHFNKREHYVVHYMTLIQALNHGLKLVKIHRILQFKQSCWLSKYVNFNTELRKKASNDFEKDLFKLMNNAVFGKTMENIRKRINIKLVSNPEKIEKLISKPEFLDRTIYNENLVAVHLAQKSIVFNKPIYVGMSVLDISKTVMFNYHYDIMIPKFGVDRLRLMYMDTDSFIYLVKTNDIFKEFMDLLDHMDTSDYPSNHQCFSLDNRKRLGKFKDELKSEIITAFVALRAKMYSILTNQGIEKKKIKGITKKVVEQKISFNDYVDCLMNETISREKMVVIQSKKHNISTFEINKVTLSPFDDKRLVSKDKVSTTAHGYLKNK